MEKEKKNDPIFDQKSMLTYPSLVKKFMQNFKFLLLSNVLLLFFIQRSFYIFHCFPFLNKQNVLHDSVDSEKYVHRIQNHIKRQSNRIGKHEMKYETGNAYVNVKRNINKINKYKYQVVWHY